MSDEADLQPHEIAEAGGYDADDVTEARSSLEAIYGPDETKVNLELAQRHINRLPSEERERLFNTRGPDGRLFANDLGELRALIDKARQPPPSLQAEIDKHGGDRAATFKALMGDRTSIYWSDARVQAAYRDHLRSQNPARLRDTEATPESDTAPATLTPDFEPIRQSFTQGMADAAPRTAETAIAWFTEMRGKTAPRSVEVKHRYLAPACGKDDAPIVDDFLNRMHAAGASQSDVDRAFAWWEKEIVPRLERGNS